MEAKWHPFSFPDVKDTSQQITEVVRIFLIGFLNKKDAHPTFEKIFTFNISFSMPFLFSLIQL